MRTVLREIQPILDASFTIRQERAAQFAAPFHFHRGYELTYLVKGYGKFYGGNQVLNFTEGDIYLFGPNFSHYFVNDRLFMESGELGHSIAIQFRNDSLERVFEQLPEMQSVCDLLKQASSGIKVSNANPQIYKLLLAITQAQRGSVTALVLFIQIISLLAQANAYERTIIEKETNKVVRKEGDTFRLDAVYQFVLGHFTETITTSQAASLACMQDAAFCRYFKRKTGKTFSTFVNTVRITHAIHLLSRSARSMTDVCHQSGFSNVSYFNRQFKLLTGLSPIEYRKKTAR